MILDLHLPLGEEVTGVLDRELHRLSVEAAASPDPDAEGIFDRVEYVTGLGFIVCQNYVAACAGSRGCAKSDVLQLGPKHRCGESMVAVVNAAANYWKHHETWGVAGAAPSPRTTEVLAALGIQMTEYLATNVLTALLDPLPIRFATLLPFLTKWRDALPRSQK
jgi:hypothetical protein